MSEVKENAVTLKQSHGGRLVEVHLTGKLTREDYAQFIPELERLVKAVGKLRVLMEMHAFHGWTTGGLWEDLKFDAKHFRDVERVAMVGETRWQHGMAVFCKPFTTAQIRYYEHDDIEEARRWVSEELPS